MKVTREQVEQYCSNEREIQTLQTRVNKLENKYNDLSENFLSRHISEQRDRTLELMKELQERNREVEKFVFGIEDNLTRRIFTLYYLENKKQQDIANEIHIDRSGVSRRICDFWNFAHNSHERTLQ